MEDKEFDNLEQIYEDFCEFLKRKNYQEEFDKLIAYVPYNFIDKEAEYYGMNRDLLLEFFKEKGMNELNSLAIGIIINHTIATYPEIIKSAEKFYENKIS